ncbi:MAG: DUF2586 family protein [Xanthobacteraceae bacterium]
MSAPVTKIVKANSISAQASQANGIGILCIIAPSSGGPVNQPTMFSDSGTLQTTNTDGPNVEMGAYFIDNSENQCLVIRPTTTTAGFYSNPAIGVFTILAIVNGPPAVLQTSAAHGLTTGDTVTISGAIGDTVINGTFEVTVVDTTHFSIPVTGTGSYTASSGTGTFLGVAFIGTGTSQITPGSAAAIADDYQVTVNVVLGGTVGTGPITLQAALDGVTFGAPVSIGAATSFTPLVPVTGASSGVVFNLGTGTLVTGDTWQCNVTGPRMTTSDLTAALNALAATALAYDMILIHGETSGSFVSIVDTWITSRAAFGKFPFAFLNTRHKYLPTPSEETDAAFQTAMSTLLATSSSINVCVGTDAADVVSIVSGLIKPQPPSLIIATRLEQMPVGVDAARVSDGPVPNANITLANGNPKWHNEFLQPGLDSLTIRLSTLRTFPDRSGVFVTNAYVLSSTGSAYVYAQHVRIMNAAAAAVFSAMTTLLSSGYERSAKTGLITPKQALKWQSYGQSVVDAVIAGQVSGTEFIVSQNDVNLGNGPATITCTLENESLGYVKIFNVNLTYVNTLPN